jgi:hypothetical protein
VLGISGREAVLGSKARPNQAINIHMMGLFGAEKVSNWELECSKDDLLGEKNFSSNYEGPQIFSIRIYTEPPLS